VISKKVIALCAVVGVAVSGYAFAVPATAEPVSNSFTIVGSDTLEDAVNAIANGSSLGGATVRASSAGANIGSFDATGSVTIITKPYGVRFARPNGSSDGVLALSKSISGAGYTSKTAANVMPLTVITGEVDIARSSSKGTVVTGGALLQIPFGRDAFTYAYDSTNTDPDLAYIALADMKLIYECDGATLSKYSITQAVIPQAGSGTRKDFLKKLNIEDNATFTDRSCVVVGQEHDASTLTSTQIMPMAASRWVAMNTGASYAKKTPTTIVGSLVAGQLAVTGEGINMAPNAAYYNDTTWGRDTYLVVEAARLDPANEAKYSAALAQLLDPDRSQSLANVTFTGVSKAGTLKGKFGFVAPIDTAPSLINVAP
jgi:hypothetical protein